MSRFSSSDPGDFSVKKKGLSSINLDRHSPTLFIWEDFLHISAPLACQEHLAGWCIYAFRPVFLLAAAFGSGVG